MTKCVIHLVLFKFKIWLLPGLEQSPHEHLFRRKISCRFFMLILKERFGFLAASTTGINDKHRKMI